ncbi:hypothetical protein D3C73_1357030 [compost metagenome]
MKQPKTLWGWFLRDTILGMGIFTIILMIFEGVNAGLYKAVIFGFIMGIGRVFSEWLKARVIAKKRERER